MSAEMMVTIGDWCVTKHSDFDGPGIFADHIVGCKSGIVIGDCCWDDNDKKTKCFYCNESVPPEIQALVLLQMKL